MLTASLSPIEKPDLTTPAFPTGFTQPHSSSYAASSSGFERPAPHSTHVEADLRGAEPKPLTNLSTFKPEEGNVQSAAA